MEQAIWTNHKGEQVLVKIVGESAIKPGFVMIQKATAECGHGLFSVAPQTLVRK